MFNKYVWLAVWSSRRKPVGITPKQRVRTALAHHEPDRVPVGEIIVECDMVEQVLGHESFLRGHFKTDQAYWEGRRDEVVDSLKRDTVELARKLELDVVPVWLVPSRHKEIKRPRRIAEGVYQDEKGNILQYSEVSKWLMVVKDADAEREWRLADFVFEEPEEPDESEFEMIRYVMGELGDTHYVIGRHGGDPTFPVLGGQERGLMMWVQEPEIVKRAIEVATERVLVRDRWLIREGVDALHPDQDYSGTGGPLVNPRLLRQLSLPAMRRQCEAAHALGVQVIKHACGNNWAILDLFVEAGYDAYQGIQGGAGMDVRRLKETYGDKLAIWGGVQIENLILGTRDDVRRDVEYALRYAAVGGGLVLNSSHAIVPGTKYDNFMTMLDVAREKGAYPISI